MGSPSHFHRPRSRRIWLNALLSAALLLSNTAGSTAEQSTTATPAPLASFRTLSGETLELSDYLGKPVLLSFWSTSCAICLREMPAMTKLYHALKDAGADMISITMPYDPPNLVVEETARQSLPFPVAIDLDGSLMRDFDVPGTPIKILISPDGKINKTFLGELDYPKTLESITSLVPAGSANSVKP